MYTFEPLPGVLCGGLVPRGSWGAGDGGRNFQEAMRRKRKHDAEIKEEMMRVMSSGVLRCEPRMDVDEVAETREEMPPVPEEVVRVLERLPAVVFVDYRLPFQRFCPEKAAHFVGNVASRDAAVAWLKHWKASLAFQKPRKAAEALLLLYGHVGTGKSLWARRAALLEDFSLAHYTPGDGGAHDVQKLDFWLRSQPSRNLRGQPMAVILDDVDELFRACPAAKNIKVNCPIIGTAGAAPEAALRNKCDKALFFAKLQPYEAKKVVMRLMPRASEENVSNVVVLGDGDIRQLMIRSCLGWNLPGVTDGGDTSFGRAQAALHGEEALAVEGEDDRHSYALMHHNFHGCCPGDSFLQTYASFLEDVAVLDSIKAMHLVPSAVRRWRERRGRRQGWGKLDPVPMVHALERDVDAAVKERPEGEATMGAYAKHEWVARRPKFRPGLQLAAGLLVEKLGSRLAEEATKEHSWQETMEEACVSSSLRLGAHHLEDIAGLFKTFA